MTSALEASFPPLELRTLRAEYHNFDQASANRITPAEVKEVLKKIALNPPETELNRLIQEQDPRSTGQITFEMVLAVAHHLRGAAPAPGARRHQVIVPGSVVGTHSYSEEEKAAFAEYINTHLHGDPELASFLPIPAEGDELFHRVSNGILLCKLINDAKPGTIEERVMNKKARLSIWEVQENQNLALNSAKSIGCSIVNIGATDIIEGRPHLVLAVLWQVVRLGLTRKINLIDHPELFRLLEEGESLDAFRKQPPENILLRWFNYHLKKANHPRRVNNFSEDVKDSVNYTVLLNQIAPQHCDRAPLDEQSLERRADMVLTNAEKLGCRRFIHPRDIVAGNHKLNLSFVAALFNAWPALEPPPQEDLSKLQVLIEEENSAESREERAFRNWINNLGIEGHIDNLFTDLQDGTILLQVLDRIRPGIVAWTRVNRAPKLVFKKTENTDYACELSRAVGCKIVGFSGRNITEGHKLYTLALVWQLMRIFILNFLKEMAHTQGRDITEANLVEMANQKLTSAGKPSRIRDFRDPAIRNGIPLIDLVAAIEPRAITEEMIKRGDSAEDKTMNAKYAIAAARKIGCAIFCVHEDITEGKDKLIMTFVGSVLSVQPQH